MHASVARLLEFASRKGQEGRAQAADLRALTVLLDVTPAVMTNWKARGISKDGALGASVALGCSANWVLTGAGAAQAQERSLDGKASSVLQALVILGAAFAAMENPKARKAAAGMLYDYIDDPADNGDMLSLIARRLAGEITPLALRKSNGSH